MTKKEARKLAEAHVKTHANNEMSVADKQKFTKFATKIFFKLGNNEILLEEANKLAGDGIDKLTLPKLPDVSSDSE